MVGWGRNDEEQVDVPRGLTEVAAIVAGRNHSLALLEDGTPVGWGDNTFGQLEIPGTVATALSAGRTVARPNFTAPIAIIASGPAADHTLALDANGELVALGRNDAGQTDVPENLTDVLAIAAGARHSLALVETAELPRDDEPEVPPFVAFCDAEELDQGFYLSSWYGTFNADLFPWIFHLQHGFQFAHISEVGEGIFLFDDDTQDWWWTDSSSYLAFYSFGRTTWNFYFEETADPRQFVDMETGAFWNRNSSRPLGF